VPRCSIRVKGFSLHSFKVGITLNCIGGSLDSNCW